MVSLYGILNIGALGINAAQAGLDTTGHNIANANTEGFTRQRMVQTTVDPIVLPNGAFGNGVQVTTIERLRDVFLETQIRASQSKTSFNEEMERIFTRLEAIINDPLDSISESNEPTNAGGLNNAISRFFRSMNDLSNTPESPEVRTSVIENTQILSETFNFVREQMFALLKELNGRVEQMATQINKLSNDLVTMNSKIASIQSAENVEANDFQDQRDRILKKLSGIIPITTVEDASGIMNISVEGQWLVDHLTTNPLQLEVSKRLEDINIKSLRLDETGLFTIDDDIREGKLGAVLDARDRLIPSLLDDLDELANGIIREVNKIHSASSGLEGYNEIESTFKVPRGTTEPDTIRTLDRIFNNNPLSRGNVEKEFPVQNGEFNIRTADENNNEKGTFSVKVNTDDTLFDITERIDRSDGVASQARSAFTFEPVFVNEALSGETIPPAELPLALNALTIANGAPIAETPGAHSFDIFMKDVAGQAIDSDLSTSVIDPFTVNFNDTDTLADLANAIQTAGNGRIRANLVPDEDDPTLTRLQIKPVDSDETLSIQNDTSGLIQAFDFPMTDPSLPLTGGNTTESTTTFSGLSSASFLGGGSPNFSPTFPGPPPNVISSGSFEFVLIDNNNVPTVNTINIDPAGIDTLDELEVAIEAIDPNLDVQITPDNEFIITANNNRSFFFQNDDTGLIEAMGLEDISGFGDINGQPFTDGSFEIVVANQQGTVTQIVEVPIQADPSVSNGILSLQGIVDAINTAAGNSGAPVRASIVKDPTDSSRSQIQVETLNDSEFTFRSDDSLVLSALGFADGPVLSQTDDPPIMGADSPIAVGDNIGGIVRAELIVDQGIRITTSGTDQFSFAGDSSHFLTAAGLNGLFTGNDAGTIQVNNEIVENSNLLAASADGTTGNNESALAMAQLEDQNVIDDRTPGEFYRTMISRMGSEGEQVKQSLNTTKAILNELEALQEDNAGVSLDEESVNIIRFQQAFQASARIISTVDQMLDIVINQLGR